MTTNLGKLVVR